MKLYLPLIASAIVLASCSTAYQTGYTPDDVYYSPERQRDEYAHVEERDERRYRGQNEEELREDRYLRMKASYRRYSMLDDYDTYGYIGSNYNRYYNYYRYNNYSYHNPWYYNNWNYNHYNPYYYNPYYNNPYYGGYVVGNVRPVYNKPRSGNLYTYDQNNNNYNNKVPRNNGRTFGNSPSANDNYRGSGTNAGGFLRNIFGSGNNSSNSNANSSSRPSSSPSSTPSSSSSNSSSSGSKSAPSRKF